MSGTISDFMEWAEGDDFITEDTNVRDSCESAWDAAWAQQDFRIKELEAQAVWAEQVMRNYDCHDEFCDGLAALQEKGE